MPNRNTDKVSDRIGGESLGMYISHPVPSCVIAPDSKENRIKPKRRSGTSEPKLQIHSESDPGPNNVNDENGTPRHAVYKG